MSASLPTAPVRLLVLGFLGIAVIGCAEVSRGVASTASAGRRHHRAGRLGRAVDLLKDPGRAHAARQPHTSR